MMVPWTASEHVSMHWRPDAVIDTSVIQPMWIRQVSPVDMATHTIDPFIRSVRGMGPAVSPYPAPEDIAYAAGKLAQQFAQGKSAVICAGTEKIKVTPQTPPGGGIVGTITQAAQRLAKGETVAIQIGIRRVVVCNGGPGGEPVVSLAPPAHAAMPGPIAQMKTLAPGKSEMSTRPTPMTMEQQQKASAAAPAPAKTGFGQSPLFEMLPKTPGPGHVPQYPFLDYAYYFRKLNYDDNVWGRRQFQADLAHRYVPNAIAAMNAATNVPIHDAQRQARVPLDTRPRMVQSRWPHPEAVWPDQAVTSVAVRSEQRY